MEVAVEGAACHPVGPRAALEEDRLEADRLRSVRRSDRRLALRRDAVGLAAREERVGGWQPAEVQPDAGGEVAGAARGEVAHAHRDEVVAEPARYDVALDLGVANETVIRVGAVVARAAVQGVCLRAANQGVVALPSDDVVALDDVVAVIPEQRVGIFEEDLVRLVAGQDVRLGLKDQALPTGVSADTPVTELRARLAHVSAAALEPTRLVQGMFLSAELLAGVELVDPTPGRTDAGS